MVITMPFGMGPFGWFLLPYMINWFRYTYGYWPWPWFYPWMPWWISIYPTTPYAPGYMAPPGLSKEEEIKMLEEQAKFLEQQLNEIRKRIEELKK